MSSKLPFSIRIHNLVFFFFDRVISPFLITSNSAGSYLVGDFASGADLYFRQEMNVQVFYQDSVNAQQNMVTIRCEERIALALYNSNEFIAP
jgi:hypothetical protein